MCYKHDDEIETHNDMIQMLENVNEINITLKIQQITLQKKIKDKNVIIHHLKIALSQQNTSVLENQLSTKLTKLSNSFLFEDSLQNVNN
jgi:hypothetical protein